MDIKKLQRVIVDGLEDVKGQNIVVFDTEHLSSLFERVIIASGTSNRQTKALASSVRDAVKQAGQVPPRVEGEVNGEWIIVDCGAAVVHLMQPNIREYYHLEEIWGEKPVKMKLDTAPRRLVKAEEPEAPAKKVAAKKVAAKKAPAGKTASPVVASKAAPKPAAKAPAKTAAKVAPAQKSPVRKTPAPVAVVAVEAPVAKRRSPLTKTSAPSRAAAPVKSGVTRTVGVKVASAAAKPAPARKAPARQAPARKPAASVAPSARVASRSAPVKTMVVNQPVARKVAAKSSVKAAPGRSAAKAPAKKAPARKTSRSA
jgi:ribosome-associated protein